MYRSNPDGGIFDRRGSDTGKKDARTWRHRRPSRYRLLGFPPPPADPESKRVRITTIAADSSRVKSTVKCGVGSKERGHGIQTQSPDPSKWKKGVGNCDYGIDSRYRASGSFSEVLSWVRGITLCAPTWWVGCQRLSDLFCTVGAEAGSCGMFGPSRDSSS